MNFKLDSKKIPEKVGIFTLMAVLIFGCATSPKLTQTPVVKPTKTSAPSTPHIVENGSPPVENFSLEDANRIPPSDVLEELHYAAVGGGDDEDTRDTICEGNFQSPAIVEPFTSTEVDIFSTMSIESCGWWLDTYVAVSIILPDGTTIVDKSEVRTKFMSKSSTPFVMYSYTTSINDPPGIYKFIFQGESGYITHNVKVVKPQTKAPSARFLWEEKDNIYYLYGFRPNESVRLFIYNYIPESVDEISFTAWQSYTTDQNGELLIKVDDINSYFFIGEISGPVDTWGGGVGKASRIIKNNATTTNTTSAPSKSCSKTLPSRLIVGEYAYVATDPPLKQRVREKAKTSSSIVGLIPPGNSMKILDGPKCADGWAWWKVQSIEDPKLVGWTSEGDEVYWLIPCDSLSSCP